MISLVAASEKETAQTESFRENVWICGSAVLSDPSSVVELLLESRTKESDSLVD